MRWSLALVLVAAVAASAMARRRAPTPPKKKPQQQHAMVAIARTAAVAAEPTKAPEPNQYTNDPILAGAERVVGHDKPGYVAFTFDDGPSPETTPAVLAALEKYNIPATFFIVTRHITEHEAEKGRELLTKEIADGFTIGNHTAHHANLTKADEKKLFAEMDEAFATLSTEAKRPIGLFRAPYGRLNAKARARLTKLGATEVFWSIDTRDWQLKDATKLRKKVLRDIRSENGGVVLMHDTRKITAETISSVLDDLEAENCRRLAAKEEPIWPVSLHYFLREPDNSPRALPEDVVKRTAAYQAALPGRCALRQQPAK
ncbi:MAG TPA: polysaccharide deacetylase family protein [Kofleriaceae bacterium]|nr:polysaccharide deacetylase family protein [Kofleriaceae bacterium]